MKTYLYTAIALCAFAGNSILCRLALGQGLIDASSFTSIRLISGVLFLLLVLNVTNSRQINTATGNWPAALMLFIYAITFSFAYVLLDTATGALILFTAVQITMVSVGVMSGNKLHRVELLGLAIAFLGFVYLMLPGLTSPSLYGFILMSMSGIAWGLYTLLGKNSAHPLSDTAYNFLRTLPFVALLFLLTIQELNISWLGFILAVVSGAIASGAGYTIWYIALRNLSNVQAAVLQLLVPVLAALGGVFIADEAMSMRLILSTVIIIGGISIVIIAKQYLFDDR